MTDPLRAPSQKPAILIKKFRLCVFVATLSFTVAGCADEGPRNGSASDIEEQKIFDEADREIAAKLSIGGNQLEKAETPLAKAVMCELALATLQDRLRASGAINAEQLAAFEQIRESYRESAQQAAGSSEGLAAARRDVETAYPDESERTRLGVACLRNLM